MLSLEGKGLLAGGLRGAALIALLVMAQACTVRPLYQNPSAGGTESVTSRLSSVSIKPAATRQAQLVRNRLAFLFYGGATEPSSAQYSLDLQISSINEVSASVQVTTLDDEPTASMITMIGRYTVVDAATGEKVAGGVRQVTSPYDVPRQEFAALRAQRDAESRAARELAELLHLAIANDLKPR